MKAKNCTWQDLQEALSVINEKYDNNVILNPDNNGVKRFTLRVKNKAERENNNGVAISASGRLTNSACWHVHGDFFDALFEIVPEAMIVSLNNKITKDYGNWQDYRKGMYTYASERCDC